MSNIAKSLEITARIKLKPLAGEAEGDYISDRNISTCEPPLWNLRFSSAELLPRILAERGKYFWLTEVDTLHPCVFIDSQDNSSLCWNAASVARHKMKCVIFWNPIKFSFQKLWILHFWAFWLNNVYVKYMTADA